MDKTKANYWSRLMWSCEKKTKTVKQLMKENNIKYSPRKDKTYVVEYEGKKIHFGDPNMRIKSNIQKRKKSYCARSKGIK